MVKNVVAAACLLFLAALAAGASVSHEELRRVEDRFLAPCCWSESVAVHQSSIATEMRAEIAQFLESGKTEDQIVDLYVAQYGERILRVPRGGRSLWLTIIPFVALLGGGLFLWQYITRIRGAAPQTPLPESLPALPDLEDF